LAWLRWSPSGVFVSLDRRISPYIDDNYHYIDEGARTLLGAFDSLERAIAACRKRVERSLEERFSAWTYAAEQAQEICND
jgi:hypothetical protein